MLFGNLKNGGKVTVDFRDDKLVLDCVIEQLVETA
jgi:hypothetical protein